MFNWKQVNHIGWYIEMTYRSYTSSDFANINGYVHKIIWPHCSTYQRNWPWKTIYQEMYQPYQGYTVQWLGQIFPCYPSCPCCYTILFLCSSVYILLSLLLQAELWFSFFKQPYKPVPLVVFSILRFFFPDGWKRTEVSGEISWENVVTIHLIPSYIICTVFRH